jgi:hypothetical protein
MSIERNSAADYRLVCDYCEEAVDVEFETFYEAVDYKKENGWKPVKDKDNDWQDLCPECQSPDIIRKLKGV